MSRKVPLKNLSNEDRTKIMKDLVITYDKSKYNYKNPDNKITMVLYGLKDAIVTIPFSYNIKFPRAERKDLLAASPQFNGELREEQKDVTNEAIQHLTKTGATIIAAACGFGKTAMSIYLSTVVKLKTLIICNRIVMINQWKESLEKFIVDVKVKVLKPKKDPCLEADYFIVNAINVPKFSQEFYKNIGFVIVDEAHQILADKLSKGLVCLSPRYLLGLSATPYRNDGLDILFKLYFGENKIFRKLYREHTVYICPTKFAPEAKDNRIGQLDWNDIIQKQADNVERNELIIKLLKHFSDRTFLVICKRLSQADYLIKRLTEENESVTNLIRDSQTYDKSCRILIGISGKVSTGFDDVRLDALLLAADIKDYFIQYLGRVFRKKETVPLILDFDDNFGVLKKHLSSRKKIYIDHGGKIKTLKIE